MPKREVITLHSAFDSGIVLGDNESLIGKHIIQGGNVYGNVIFNQIDPAILIVGSGSVVKHCIVEGGVTGIEVR